MRPNGRRACFSTSSVVSPVRGAPRYGALLLTTAHGITGLDLSGHMDLDKWHTTAEELVDTVISVLPKSK